MRRLAPPLIALLMLAGCSGLGRFEQDSFTLPGANPALPSGASETMLRVQAKPYDAPSLTPEGGNVWPGAPTPFPTLGEVEHESQQKGGGPNGDPPQGPAASAAPQGSPSQGSASQGSASQGNSGSVTAGRFQMHANPNAASTIVIPNGDGTSTAAWAWCRPQRPMAAARAR